MGHMRCRIEGTNARLDDFALAFERLPSYFSREGFGDEPKKPHCELPRSDDAAGERLQARVRGHRVERRVRLVDGKLR